MLREMGTYTVRGTCVSGQVELELKREDADSFGRARGRLEESRLELELVLLSRDEKLASRGQLLLEADVEWRVSPVFKLGKTPRDRGQRPWYQPDFDDAGWTSIELPDDNSFGQQDARNRFYRSHFWLGKPQEAVSVKLSEDTNHTALRPVSQESEAVNLVFSSDDGVWIYVNGRFLGHWGAPEKRGGCVNDPLKRCGIDGSVPAVSVPESFLRPGDNVIAVKVHNGECCFSYFSLLVTRVRTRLVSEPVP
jgi:hypothetical protein